MNEFNLYNGLFRRIYGVATYFIISTTISQCISLSRSLFINFRIIHLFSKSFSSIFPKAFLLINSISVFWDLNPLSRSMVFQGICILFFFGCCEHGEHAQDVSGMTTYGAFLTDSFSVCPVKLVQYWSHTSRVTICKKYRSNNFG